MKGEETMNTVFVVIGIIIIVVVWIIVFNWKTRKETEKIIKEQEMKDKTIISFDASGDKIKLLGENYSLGENYEEKLAIPKDNLHEYLMYVTKEATPLCNVTFIYKCGIELMIDEYYIDANVLNELRRYILFELKA